MGLMKLNQQECASLRFTTGVAEPWLISIVARDCAPTRSRAAIGLPGELGASNRKNLRRLWNKCEAVLQYVTTRVNLIR